ncbi:MAG: HpcH/HpaI aldolase/citrate lyase family protein [Gammaproteobacteria bacterium]|uniref:HpcH/HpaI aldolase/citrate lyase family protein n=1 Tax=Pseudacidovorax sp. TaxID=1934311 RepID=UPI001B5D9F68|nr:CoA ester lyase [Pseudacidovorax sp.]MBP6895586.1 CoA ester lyase [Pseudacidovorax sp.]
MAALHRPARSYLFVPGDRPERFAKAWDSDADAVILDLEDAVAPQDKDAARAAVAGWLSAERPVWVRINAGDTAAFEGDLQLIGRPGLAGLMVPKAEALAPALLAAATAADCPLLALVETARGIALAQEIARTPGVARLAFGSIDFQADLGIESEEGLLPFRSMLVLASRLAGLPPPVDGVCTALDDAAVLDADSRRSRALGFGGRLCIHPKQVGTVHAAWAPTQAEQAWARRVVEAMDASGGSAVRVDGRMVDQPVLIRARQWLDAADMGRRPRGG